MIDKRPMAFVLISILAGFEHKLGEGTIETTVMNGIPTSLR